MNKILARKIRKVLRLVKPEIICKYDSLYYFDLYMERKCRAFCKEYIDFFAI